jgi:hypothetical protein
MAEGPSGPGPRFSDDRQWYWNGSAWIPASQAPVPPPGPPPVGPAFAAPQAGVAAMAMPPRKGHLGRNLGIGCAGLIGLVIVVAIAANAANGGSKSPNSTSAASVISPAATATGPRLRRQHRRRRQQPRPVRRRQPRKSFSIRPDRGSVRRRFSIPRASGRSTTRLIARTSDHRGTS